MAASELRRFLFWFAYFGAIWCWHVYLSEMLTTTAEPQRPRPQQQQQQHNNHIAAGAVALTKTASSSSTMRTTSSPPPSAAREKQQTIAALLQTSPPPPPLLTGCPKGGDTKEHRDLDGAVMVPGYGPGALSLLPEECCAACQRTRGCNVWVSCMDEKACGKQCWLKWAEDPSKPAVRGENSGVPWASGTLLKDVPSSHMPSKEELDKTRVVVLSTEQGDLRITLRPDWHLPSVNYVRQVALADTCTIKCQFYRAEPGFLLQGAIRAVTVPNKICRKFRNAPKECDDEEERPGGSVMEKGDVAWAGGSAGPDFFITMGRVPGFGGTHTVWGRLADEASMKLAQTLVQAKISPLVKPGEMHIIDKPITFTLKRGDDA